MRHKPILMLFVTAACGMSCRGDILSVSGNARLIPQPADARIGELEDSIHILVWRESQDVTLQNNLRVNATEPGRYDDEADLGQFELPAQLRVSSYFVHYDPVGNGTVLEGVVVFSSDVLGVIAENEGGTGRAFDLSNYLGAPTLFTEGNNMTGLEFGPTSDWFVLTPNRRTLTFHFSNPASAAGDHLRVITALPACPGDYNGDGRIDSNDFFQLLAAFFALDPMADFNDDGLINTSDYFDFLRAFFLGCN